MVGENRLWFSLTMTIARIGGFEQKEVSKDQIPECVHAPITAIEYHREEVAPLNNR
jgi:hypothetical protein